MIALSSGLLAAEGDGLASMWRIELLHPMVVHLPIALSFVAFALWLTATVGHRSSWLKSLGLAARVLLVVAVIGAWAAVQTGEWADHEVGRSLWDPRNLKDHENLAELATWLLTAALATELLRHAPRLPKLARRIGTAAVGLLLAGACATIAWAAHMGAGLVYQQGAGVILPGGVR